MPVAGCRRSRGTRGGPGSPRSDCGGAATARRSWWTARSRGGRRAAPEDTAATGRIAGSLLAVRPGNRHLVDRRGEPRMPVQVEVSLVRLAFGFEQRGWLLQEGHAELVRSGSHLDLLLEMKVD